MISGTLAGIIIALSITELFGQIFIKTYYETQKVYWFFIAWFFYLLVIYLLYRAYYFTGFAIANGLWSAFALILTTLVGIFYYKETLNNYELAGIILIVIGIIVLGFYSDDKTAELE